MLDSQDPSPPEKTPEQLEIVELSTGLCRFLDVIVERMLEEDIKKYYQGGQTCVPKEPQN